MNAEPEAVYPYTDGSGELLFEKVRLPGKRFQQRRPDGNGAYIYNLNGVAQVLYRLPALVAHLEHGKPDPIYVVEGEKDADAIATTGATATTNPGGAGKWRDEHTDVLMGARHVIIVADRDEQGVKHASTVAACLRPVVDQLDVVQAAEGKDAFDHLQHGHELDEFVPLELGDDLPLPDIEPHSWTPIDLIATASEPPEPATIGGIAYPGRRHVYSGEPETLKSWAALVLCVKEIRGGRDVLYVDFNEMGGRDVLERLRALGLEDETIRERFIYIEPHEAMTVPSVLADVAELVRDRAPSLVVLDAFTGALATHHLNPDSGVEVQRFYSTVVDPLRAGGAGLLLLDHLKKDPTNRGKFAIGSERKIGACEVHLGFDAIKPFGRGKRGLARIVVHKDRPGYLARPKCAELELTSDPETGRVSWTLTLSEQTAEDDRPFRPTFLMERVSRYVESAGEVESRNALQRAVKGNARALRQAIEILVAEEYLSESDGPRNAKPLSSLRPYREADEA